METQAHPTFLGRIYNGEHEDRAQGNMATPTPRTSATSREHDTRAVSEQCLKQLRHHLSKATEKSANRHVHQAMLVLDHMLQIS